MEIRDFATIVLVVAAGFLLALALTKVTERYAVPSPALFLVVAAVASDLWPNLELEVRTVERIGVVALIVILFDGGMEVGWRRFRAAALPITLLGVLGTFAAAGLIAVVAHALFDFGWTTAGILGAALAPTDPAVMFSVLGRREVGGRTGTILEGESGANDPVGIALMLGMLEFATHDNASFWVVVREFSLQLAIGLGIGVAGAAALLWLMRGIRLPSEALYPIRTLAAAGVIYGVASLAHGSGFLAVFVAGLLVGDVRAPYKGEIERFHKSLASLAEMVVFAALGLTIHLGGLPFKRVWIDGLLLALVLAFLVRPAATALLLTPIRLRRGERLFVMWGGLKGAVPILLATFALLAGVEQDERIYGIVFVVVLFSVVVQGTSIPQAARALGIPMRPGDARGTARFVVAEDAVAAGRRIDELPLGRHSWIEEVSRSARPVEAGRSTILVPGDEVVVIGEFDDAEAIRSLFEVDRGRH
jgi:cell volume regulation protein A